MQQTNQTILTPSRDSSGAVLAALKAAFPKTIPVLTGYFVLGLGYGIYVQSLGLPIWLPPLMGTVVYGGSLEFVLASLLLGSFSPLSAFLMALMIQARHLFYGLTMLERYQGYGPRGFYMIYAMSDETFSITCSAEPPEGVDRGWFMFFITLLDQIYWVASAFLGAAVGSILPFLIFSSKDQQPPEVVRYLGRVLPAAIFGMLILYCLKGVSVFTGSHGIPEAIAIGVTIALHKWKHETLVSIAGGTLCYVLLVQLVF